MHIFRGGGKSAYFMGGERIYFSRGAKVRFFSRERSTFFLRDQKCICFKLRETTECTFFATPKYTFFVPATGFVLGGWRGLIRSKGARTVAASTVHSDGPAHPALMSRAVHPVEAKGGRGPHRSRRQPMPVPGLRRGALWSCGARLVHRASVRRGVPTCQRVVEAVEEHVRLRLLGWYHHPLPQQSGLYSLGHSTTHGWG
jgi:hypothetical protein